jgi:alpha-N-arabinofuranosidase
MANIAQTVNVLQAVVLTEGDRMLRTPTYHAFEMYTPFKDATFLPLSADSIPDYELGDVSVPRVSATAALSREGSLVVALVNLHAQEDVDVSVLLDGYEASAAAGRVLAGDTIDAHNTFDEPDSVVPVPLSVALGSDEFHVSLPPRSVSVITLVR